MAKIEEVQNLLDHEYWQGYQDGMKEALDSLLKTAWENKMLVFPEDRPPNWHILNWKKSQKE